MKALIFFAVLFVAAHPWSAASALDREELVAIVALDAGISELEARSAVASVFDSIIESVANDEIVLIEGFGGFLRHQERTTNVPAFVPAPSFRNAVK